ncbi:MAG: cytochrome c3 family protein [Bacteroidetes bacterium]|nr:cytochrome c3 family protein [Bacteroidota bacterium]MCL5034941.1 cytochrome c3 family protein [Bacteroidota bacterium]
MTAFLTVLLALFQIGVSNPNSRCFLCHGKANFGVVENGKFQSLYVSPKDFSTSIHGKFTCVQCHTDVKVIPHFIKPRKIICLQCHFEGNTVGAPVKWMPEKYKESVHAKALAEGNPNAPNCETCHTTHYVKSPKDSTSATNRRNVPELCGKCHTKEFEAYSKSIHYKALENGMLGAAVCTDCHQEHDVLPPNDPRSALNPQSVVNTCTKCHSDTLLMERANVPVQQPEAYSESFHGIALESGMVKAANCTSCHGHHDILPASDPASPINPRNLPKTCGKCHPNADQNVAKGKIHIIPSEKSAGVVFYVYTFFKWFTLAVLAFLFVHIVLDLSGFIRRKYARHE